MIRMLNKDKLWNISKSKPNPWNQNIFPNQSVPFTKLQRNSIAKGKQTNKGGPYPTPFNQVLNIPIQVTSVFTLRKENNWQLKPGLRFAKSLSHSNQLNVMLILNVSYHNRTYVYLISTLFFVFILVFAEISFP